MFNAASTGKEHILLYNHFSAGECVWVDVDEM